MNGVLLLAYLPYYRTTLVMRAEPGTFSDVARAAGVPQGAAARTILYGLCAGALVLGVVMVLWHATMIYRHFAR